MRYRLEAGDGGSVVVDADRIAEVVPGGAPDAAVDFALPLGPGRLRPGLINAHDHLHRNHYPRLGESPYPDAYAWGRDLHDRFGDDIARARRLDRRDAFLFGALKNLLAGATTVVHHDRWEPILGDAFPVRVPRVRIAHSLRFEPDLPTALAGDDATAGRPLAVHLAEGVNRAAAAEVDELRRLGALDDRLLAVHLVGVDPRGIRALRAAGAAAVWCPTSNEFLFGRTAPPALFEPGLDVLLGTDALLTGAGTLLDELRAARRWGRLDDARLLDAVGTVAARRLGLPPPVVAPGAPADLVVLRAPALDARAADVALVLVAGAPRLGDAAFGELFERLGVATQTLDVAGTRKLVAAPLASVAERVVERSPECGRIFERGAGSAGSAARVGDAATPDGAARASAR